MHNYSPEELILYLYKETAPSTTAAIEDALQKDWTLREKLAVLKASMERLDSIVVEPRSEAVRNILDYAAKQDQLTPSK